MEQLIYYLLKVSIATAVFYGTYYFLLRNSKHFVFNRIYLAGSFFAAFIIPLITFKTSVRLSQASIYFSGNVGSDAWVPVTTGTATATDINMAALLLGLYLCGVLYFLVRLIYGYSVAAGILKSCTKKNVGDLEILVSEEDNLAFTFLNRIIIGKNLLDHPSLEMVLKHEAVHSREKHFLDIILAELLSLLQWFNPFARFHAQAIRNNLEFRADDVVIQASDRKGYQLTMLGMALNSIDSTLFTAINSSNLKKRIAMMNAKNQNQFGGIARCAIIPVVALLLLSLSGKETIMINESGLEAEKPNHNSHTLQEKSTDPIHFIEDITKFLARNIKYPTSARSAGEVGTVRLYARVNQDGTIKDVFKVQPEKQFVELKEIVIVGYPGDDSEEIKKTKSANHETLIEEGKRVINAFPKLEIPELQGEVIQFVFKFDMRYDRKDRIRYDRKVEIKKLNPTVFPNTAKLIIP